jgi:ABC-type lipoprotein export system ATPase subunit
MGHRHSVPTSPPSTLAVDINECVTVEGNLNMDKLQAVWKKWEEGACNIAIIGASGSGKSTLINNLLGVPPEDEENTYVHII